MLKRLFRRWWLDRRIAYWQREVANLERIRETIVPQLDHAIRILGGARSERVFLDIGRPPITHVAGGRDSMDRRAQIREVEARG